MSVYANLYEEAWKQTGVQERIKWIRRQPADHFYPQPYEQLAAVLRKAGHETEARDILIAKNEDPERLKHMGWRARKWHRFLGRTIGYGYRPLKALGFMLGFVLAGWLLFYIGFPLQADYCIKTGGVRCRQRGIGEGLPEVSCTGVLTGRVRPGGRPASGGLLAARCE